MRPPRPALAPVLAAMTCDDVLGEKLNTELFALHAKADPRLKPGLRLTDHDVTTVHHVGDIALRAMGPLPWTLRPEEAVEALAVRELVPAHWADPSTAPRWRCERHLLGGFDVNSPSDRIDLLVRAARGVVPPHCPCGGAGTVASPSLAALASVASLGVAVLTRVEAVAAEAWGARVVWRSVARADLREHHDDVGGQWMLRGDDSPPTIFSFEALWAMDAADDPRLGLDREPWSTDYAPVTTDRAEEAWPALRALGLLGVHLLAHHPLAEEPTGVRRSRRSRRRPNPTPDATVGTQSDGAPRVVIGVEALG